MPLQRRLPKRGFTNIFRKDYVVVNLRDLAVFAVDDVVNPEGMRDRGIIRRPDDRVKVLGDGELKSPLTISAHHFSKSALEKIAKAGGKAEVLPR